MDWRSHALIGIVATAIVLFFMGLRLESIVLLAIFAGFSALLPDIDHQMSKIRAISDRAFPIFALVYSYNLCSSCNILETAKNALLLVGVYFLVVTFLKPKHRGITHSILFVLIYGATLFLLFNINIAIAGAVGYASHLLA